MFFRKLIRKSYFFIDSFQFSSQTFLFFYLSFFFFELVLRSLVFGTFGNSAVFVFLCFGNIGILRKLSKENFRLAQIDFSFITSNSSFFISLKDALDFVCLAIELVSGFTAYSLDCFFDSFSSCYTSYCSQNILQKVYHKSVGIHNCASESIKKVC